MGIKFFHFFSKDRIGKFCCWSDFETYWGINHKSQQSVDIFLTLSCSNEKFSISSLNLFYFFYFYQVLSASNVVQFFLILSLFFNSVAGLVVASILKKLDNVVKVNIHTLTVKSLSPYSSVFNSILLFRSTAFQQPTCSQLSSVPSSFLTSSQLQFLSSYPSFSSLEEYFAMRRNPLMLI